MNGCDLREQVPRASPSRSIEAVRSIRRCSYWFSTRWLPACLLCAFACVCCTRGSHAPIPAGSPLRGADGSVRGQDDHFAVECSAAFAGKRFADAEKACRQATAADPGKAETHLLLAHALSNLGRWSDALVEATRASSLRPDWADPFAVIGSAQQQVGDPVPATRAYRRYLELAPTGRYADDIRTFLEQSPTAEFPPGAPLVLAATVTRKGPDPHSDASSESKWTSATIFVVMPRPVEKGDKVTVIPVRSGIPSLDLTVTSSKAQPETDLTPAVWLVEAETTEGAFLSAPRHPTRVPPSRHLSRLSLFTRSIPALRCCHDRWQGRIFPRHKARRRGPCGRPSTSIGTIAQMRRSLDSAVKIPPSRQPATAPRNLSTRVRQRWFEFSESPRRRATSAWVG
jgi:hypothetical protein